MNIATVRSTINTLSRTGLTALLALGAFAFVAAPQAAHAQRFAIGVQFGQPAYSYVAPAYTYGYDRDDRFRAQQFREEQFRDRQFRDHEAWERRQAFLRHEEWERQNRFNHEQFERHEAYDHGYSNGWR